MSTLRVVEAHNKPAKACAFSSDGNVVATGSFDNTIKVWDVKNGSELLTLEGHENRVFSVAISPDSKLLASSSRDFSIRIWSLETGDEIRILEDHSDDVRCCVFSPDGATLVSCSSDLLINVWKVDDGSVLATFDGHRKPVNCCCFSPDGKSILSGSDDSTLLLWKIGETKPVNKYTGHTGWILSCAFHPSGEMFASSSRDKSVRIWKTDGTLLHELKAHTSEVDYCTFSPDGALLATSSCDKTVKVWNVDDGTLLVSLAPHDSEVSCCAFNPSESTQLASTTDNGSLYFWDISEFWKPVALNVLSKERDLFKGQIQNLEGQLKDANATAATIKGKYEELVETVEKSSNLKRIQDAVSMTRNIRKHRKENPAPADAQSLLSLLSVGSDVFSLVRLLRDALSSKFPYGPSLAAMTLTQGCLVAFAQYSSLQDSIRAWTTDSPKSLDELVKERNQLLEKYFAAVQLAADSDEFKSSAILNRKAGLEVALSDLRNLQARCAALDPETLSPLPSQEPKKKSVSFATKPDSTHAKNDLPNAPSFPNEEPEDTPSAPSIDDSLPVSSNTVGVKSEFSFDSLAGKCNDLLSLVSFWSEAVHGEVIDTQGKTDAAIQELSSAFLVLGSYFVSDEDDSDVSGLDFNTLLSNFETAFQNEVNADTVAVKNNPFPLKMLLDSAQMLLDFMLAGYAAFNSICTDVEQHKRLKKRLSELASKDASVEALEAAKNERKQLQKAIRKVQFDLDEHHDDGLESSDPVVNSLHAELLSLRRKIQDNSRTIDKDLRKVASLARDLYPELVHKNSEVNLMSFVPLGALVVFSGRSLSDYNLDHSEHLIYDRRPAYKAEFCGEVCVLKEFQLPDDQAWVDMEREASILGKISHPNVIKIRGIFRDTKTRRGYLELPYYSGGTLRAYLEKPISPAERIILARDVLSGLEYLHSCGVTHGELSPDTILIDDNGKAVITEYDLTRNPNRRVSASPRSPAYTAPEVLHGDSISQAADIFSYGALLYFVIMFPKELVFHKDLSSLEDSMFVELLGKLVSDQPETRTSAMQAISHTFFNRSPDQDEFGKAFTQLQQKNSEIQHLIERSKAVDERQIGLNAERKRLEESRRTLEQKRKTLILDGESQTSLKDELETIKSREDQLFQESKALKLESLEKHTQLRELEETVAVDNNLVPVPLYWTQDIASSFREFPALANMHEPVQSLLSLTAKSVGNVKFLVKNVTRIENPTLWVKYATRRALISESLGKGYYALSPPLWTEGFSFPGSGRLMTSINEVYLFHVVYNDQGDGVKHKGFDARIGGPLGTGCYFYESPLRAIEGFKDDSVVTLFLSRVVLGKPFVTGTIHKNISQPPCVQGHFEGVSEPCMHPRLNSIVANTKEFDPSSAFSTYREFAVYDRFQCYPEFAITFERFY